MTKTQFIILLPALLLCASYAVSQLNVKRLQAISLLLLGFAVPSLLWFTYKSHLLAQMAATDPSYVTYTSAKAWYFFSMRGSGLQSLLQVYSGDLTLWDVIGRNLQLNFNKIAQAFGLLLFAKTAAAMFLLAGLASAVFIWLRTDDRSLKNLSVLLLSFWTWGFFLNDYIFYNHLLLGIWLLAVFIIHLLVRLPIFSSIVAALLMLWLVIANVFLSKQPNVCVDSRYGACVFSGENPVRAQRRQLVNYLLNNSLDAPVLTCGWLNAHEVEFVLPGVANFTECSRFFADKVVPDTKRFIELANLPAQFAALPEEAILDKFVHRRINPMGIKRSMPVQLTQSVEFYFVADPTFRGQTREQDIFIESWLRFCSESVVIAGKYELKKCSNDDFMNYLAHWEGLPFPLFDWEAHYFYRIHEIFKTGSSLKEFSLKE